MSIPARWIDRGKLLLFMAGLFPLARWVWLGMNDGLTANPTEFLTRSAGTWALVCLLVTLSISPLRTWLNVPSLLRWRRMCGLFAFFYALLHAFAWAWWDQSLILMEMWRDVLKRPFITVGMAAFIVMTLLAITSTKGWMRRLGRRWQTLHRGVYAIALLAIIHYWWHKDGKNDYAEVSVYALIAALLLGWRVLRWRRSMTNSAAPSST